VSACDEIVAWWLRIHEVMRVSRLGMTAPAIGDCLDPAGVDSGRRHATDAATVTNGCHNPAAMSDRPAIRAERSSPASDPAAIAG
jgi:hypothetical protein